MFVLTGVVTTLLGPVLPILAQWWALDDRQAGVLFGAQFLGSMLGSVLSSAGMTRIGFRPTLIAGVAAMSVGVGALGFGLHVVGIAAVVVYGVGLGLTIPTTNLYVAETCAGNRASALSVLNFAWGLGAVGAPPVVALFQRADRVALLLSVLALALIATTALVARISEPGRSAPSPTDPIPGVKASTRYRRQAALVGLLLFVYVGTETSVAGWVALYAQRLDVVTATDAAATPSLFWAALLGGRAAVPVLLQSMSEATLLTISLAVATAGVAALTASRSVLMLATSVVVAGIGLSTVFPLVLARFTRDMERAAARTAGPVFVLAGFGGAVLPPLVGLLSSATGTLTAGLFVPLAGCLAMFVVLLAWRRASRRRCPVTDGASGTLPASARDA